MSFIDWLIKQGNNNNSVIVDIANEVIRDIKDGWRGKTYRGLIIRINKLDGCEDALNAAKTAYGKYKEKNHV